MAGSEGRRDFEAGLLQVQQHITKPGYGLSLLLVLGGGEGKRF